jgi:steroid delta-isomerase-like uncharacterized protein
VSADAAPRADVDALLDRWQAAWSGRDRAAFADVCTPDIHYEDPACGQPREGLGELTEHAARLWQAFPDARVERSGARLSDGRFVAAPVKVVGHHRGELDGLPPTGRFVVVQALCYCELDARGERLFRVRTFFDAWDAAVQVRILPGRGTLSERALLMLRGFGLRARS